MKEWWSGLQASERRILILGAVALLLILPYFVFWLPLQDSVISLRKDVDEQRAVQHWMQQAAAEVKQLQRSGTGTAKPRVGRSLLALVDQTAKLGKLGAGLKRLEPEGQTSVKVWLEQVSFDDMVRWLTSLEQQYSLSVSTITIDRQDTPGRVNARMTLEAGSS
jgi:general secretion pathway protein M